MTQAPAIVGTLDPVGVILRDKEREIDRLHGRILQLTMIVQDAGLHLPEGDGTDTTQVFRELSALRDLVYWWLTGRAQTNVAAVLAACEQAVQAMPVCREGDHR